MNTGNDIVHSTHGLLTTVLYKNSNGKALYALEVTSYYNYLNCY